MLLFNAGSTQKKSAFYLDKQHFSCLKEVWIYIQSKKNQIKTNNESGLQQSDNSW